MFFHVFPISRYDDMVVSVRQSDSFSRFLKGIQTDLNWFLREIEGIS